MTRRVYAKGRTGEEIQRTAGMRAKSDSRAPILPMDGYESRSIISGTVLRWACGIMGILIVLSFFDGRGGW
jgi:hypothetical protein